ncbi:MULTISPECIES: CHAT domain-containing protein [unclassified Streptomyces]|uniref:CHAT domain-containing protein n=1 Tax=unclassified Streptomyces TaxID=2593676 RepID=UPI001BEB4923|nr:MULTISPECIES: CHAT domain-containing protein [unclassified Streptomyces]MBT2406578.1 CHAT domain-containing protein [Streptomyces sp. ISL-21]MBT2608916.1 CHAT domain-containing protein [Streptomyces sp. ISL-87]
MRKREELLAAVRARVERVAATGDPSAVLEPTALDEARRLEEDIAHDTGVPDQEAQRALGWLHYRRAQALGPGQGEQDREAAVRFFGWSFVVGVDSLPQPLLTALAAQAAYAAEGLLDLALRAKDPALLTSAVTLLGRIVRNLPDGHPDRARCESNLGSALCERFERTGELADLNEAVELSRAAVRATADDHPERAGRLTNLGTALRARFNRIGDLRDLDEAVEANRDAVQSAPPDYPDRGRVLSNLGVALWARYERMGDPADLNEAVELGRAAVRATAHDHPERAGRVSNLGIALWARYQRTGELADLDEAVELGRAAVRATPPDHPNLAIRLTNLGNALEARFEHVGESGDLDDAVETRRAAVRAAPRHHPIRAGLLSNLGIALKVRFERMGESADLDEAVEAGRTAVRATPHDHPALAMRMSSLGNALRARFEHAGDLKDLDEAVQVSRGAVEATPHDHPNYAKCLSNLGIALRARFERTGDLKDLDEAVEIGRATVGISPDDHPDHATHLNRLANALRVRSERTGGPADREEAVSLWERAVEVETGPPSMRLHAARAAAMLAADSEPGRAAGLLERAVLMLPTIAPRRLRRGDQQHALDSRKTAGLTADAAALALADTSGTSGERAARALRLLEAGRAVLLSQALDSRSDLTDLRDQYPHLAAHFSELRELLDQDPATAATATGADRRGRTGRERHQLVAELDELLGRIRTCEGFAAFGLPPTLDDLLAEAAHGPVVTFNISQYRSDALLLTRDGVTSCPLPGLSLDTVLDRVTAFRGALAEAAAPDGDRVTAQRALRQILEWLWETAAEPALTALAASSEVSTPSQNGEALPRVWWAPGGLLGLLPLHAAGHHTDPQDGPGRRTVLDRVISSYTPTIRALRHARRRRSRPADQLPADQPRSLVVAMPTTPGHTPLPYVAEEARRIRELLPRPVQLTEPAPAPDGTALPPSADTPTATAQTADFPTADFPTAATVLARLPECAIAHFACHGASDGTDPSRSMLLLHDHATTPLTVSALAQVNLERARLAYLSACDTASLRSGPIDEAIHLTSAFQLAGFPHVVGTLWPIDDRLAVEVAESFYTHLTTGPAGTLDPDQAATALHHTIRAVRDRYPATPSLWAAYLHAGA